MSSKLLDSSIKQEKGSTSSSTKVTSPSKSKYYKQKFRASWLGEEFSPWLTRNPSNPDGPYCVFCERKLEGGISHIRRHARSSMHRKKSINSFDNLSMQKQLQGELTPSSDHMSNEEYMASSEHMEVSQLPLSNMHTQQQLQQEQLDQMASSGTTTSDPTHLGTVSIDMKSLPVITSQHSSSQDDLNIPAHGIIVTPSTNTTDGNLFHPAIDHQDKHNNDYIIGVSSC